MLWRGVHNRETQTTLRCLFLPTYELSPAPHQAYKNRRHHWLEVVGICEPFWLSSWHEYLEIVEWKILRFYR